MNNVTSRIIMLLRKEIEIKRKQMFDYATAHGMNSDITIQCSQELDILINRLNQRIYHRQTA